MKLTATGSVYDGHSPLVPKPGQKLGRIVLPGVNFNLHKS